MPIDLTYDTLPPGSSLRRQVLEDGTVTILAPAGEANPLARTQAMWATGWRSAVFAVSICGILFSVFAPLYLNARRQNPQWVSTLLAIASGLFLIALFFMIWFVWYRAWLEKMSSHHASAITIHLDKIVVDVVGEPT